MNRHEAKLEAEKILQGLKLKIRKWALKYKPKSFITSLLGPPGVGKSTSIAYLKDIHWPAVDLEDFPHDQRLDLLSLLNHGTCGAADINPKTVQPGKILWILLACKDGIYQERRRQRDEKIPFKKDQRHFSTEEWINKYGNHDSVVIFDNTSEESIFILAELIILIHNYVSKVLLDQYNFKHLTRVLDYIRQQTDKDGYKICKYPFGEIKNSTPFALFNDYELPVFKSPNLANKIVDELCVKFGKKMKYREVEVKISEALRSNKYVRRHWNYNLFTIHNRAQDENTIAFPLSPVGINIDGSINKCKYAVLTFNCAETYIFLGTFIKELLKFAETQEQLVQILNLFTDWRCTLGFSLSAAYNDDFCSKENDFEKECKNITADYFEEYFHTILNNSDQIIDSIGSELRTKLNEKKSMGAGAVLNGVPINKKKYWIVLNYLLYHPDIERNSWVYYTNLPDKLELLGQWQKMTKAFSAIKRFGFESPEAWAEMIVNDICPGNTTAFRVNGNDEALLVLSVDKKKPIWDVQTRKFELSDIQLIKKWCDELIEYFEKVQNDITILLEEGWPELPITTKPREWVNHTDVDGYYLLVISPYQFRSIFNSEVKRINREHKKGRAKYPILFPCVMLTNKLRQMYPGIWLVNTYFGPIARLYSIPFEKGDIGFINLRPDSTYLRLLQSLYPNYKVILPGSSDISHSETTMSSDTILLDLIGKIPALRTFFRFACSGLASSKIGLRWHDFSIMSGLTFTTAANIWAGIHKKSLYYAYLSNKEERKNVYENNIRIIFASAYRYLKSNCKIEIPKWVNTVPANYLLTIPTRYGKLDVIQSIGTDDQVWTFLSNSMSEDLIKKVCNNVDVVDFCQRYHNNVDLGEATHFGVKLTKTGFQPNYRGSLAKITSFEKKRQGDPMCSGIDGVNFQNTFVYPCLDVALNSIDAGNTAPYKLAAQWFLSVVQSSPDYVSGILEEYNAPFSPSGKRMADNLSRTGYAITDEKKMPLSIVKAIINHHKSVLDFI